MTQGVELLLKILSEKRLREFGKLNPDWLTAEERTLYHTILEFTRTYGLLPTPFQVGYKKFDLDEVLNSPFQFYQDTIIKRALELQFINVSADVSKLFKSKKIFEAFAVLKEFVTRFDVAKMEQKDILTMPEMAQLALEYIKEARESFGLIGVPSGWRTLDSATAGFRAGNLYVYLARVKVGKSMALAYNANTAYNLGYVVMLISMEMTDIEMALRMIAHRLGLNMKMLLRGFISTRGEQLISNIIPELQERQPFHFVNGQFKKDITEIIALVNGLKPHIVFIDGGYLIKLTKGARDERQRWDKITEITEQLKTLSITANIPIVVSFQYNRKVSRTNSDTGQWENIQLADAIGQLASAGFGIFEDEEGLPRRRIEIIGGRQGEEGSFFINWNWERMIFDEIPSQNLGDMYEQDTNLESIEAPEM